MLSYLAMHLLMKKNIPPYFLFLIVCTSCKSLQHLSAKDNSTQSRTTPQNNKSKEIVFLDNIEVTPSVKTGSLPATQQNNISNKQLVNNHANKNIANANAMQMKYASLLNTSYDQLNNITLLQNIDYWWGTSYCMGGSTTGCIDCSSFTQTIMRDVYKINIPRTAQEQFNVSERIDMIDLQEGDLVFFHTTGRNISHVGVYLTNNKFVHASTSSGVTISDLNDAYWKPRFRGAGRVK